MIAVQSKITITSSKIVHDVTDNYAENITAQRFALENRIPILLKTGLRGEDHFTKRVPTDLSTPSVPTGWCVMNYLRSGP